MMSVREARESTKDIAPLLGGISRDKKLILEGIMIGARLSEDKKNDRQNENSQPCKTDR